MRAIVLLVIAIALSGCAALAGIGAGGSSPGAEEQARLAVDIVKAMQPEKGAPILVEDAPSAALLAKKLREAGFALATRSADPKGAHRLSTALTPLAHGFLLTVNLDDKQAFRLYGTGDRHPLSAVMVRDALQTGERSHD
jgi:uncharacterized protein YceK